MKRTALIAALFLALGLAAQAQDQVLSPVLIDANNVIIKPNPTVLASANGFVKTDNATLLGAVQRTTFAQIETNAVANATRYTPAFAGQILIGSASNLVWVAKSTTTNDWIAVVAAE